MPLGMIPNGAQKNIFFKEDITMGMVVQHNMNAINSYNKLNANVAGMKKSSEKLSSGYRINRAGDDAAGLAVSEKMRSQIKGLNQAIRNSQDGINMIQTFEGAAQETHSILQRMKELASQSANGTYDNATDRAAIQLEFDQLNDELNQIADTDFNGTIVLNGGQMSDGLKAVNGEFNYATATRQAQQLGTTGGFITGVSDRDYNPTALEKGKSETVEFTAAVKDGKVTWTGKGLEGTATNNTKDGGFTYAGASIHIDTTKVVAGDTVRITFTNAADAIGLAPEVAGAKEISNTVKSSDPANPALPAAAKANYAVNAGIDDNAIKNNPNLKFAFDALQKISVEETFADATATVAGGLKINGTVVAANTKIIDVNDDKGEKIGGIYTDKDGNLFFCEGAATTTAKGTQLLDFTGSTLANKGSGVITTEINVTKAHYSKPSVEAVKIEEPAGKVSQSDSFDNSKAIMSYADNITLQTGARTKDSVNFTFKYNQDGSADMGELKANLNISARADGLNTENLSLATQDDANHAIDQIDKAINKTSMIRATFGSIQNRLEHKITNLTTTSENLTEAESSIRDTDMASEMMNYTKMNILQQAAQSMLAQANQQPQSILQLLG